MMILAMHGLIVSAAKVTFRMDSAQRDLRRDHEMRRRIGKLAECGQDRRSEIQVFDFAVKRREGADDGSGRPRSPTLFFVEDADRGTMAVSERCTLPEVCEYDMTAGACRQIGKP